MAAYNVTRVDILHMYFTVYFYYFTLCMDKFLGIITDLRVFLTVHGPLLFL